MRILPLQKLFSMLVMMCATAMVFAQPANDDCSTPTLLEVGADAASCIVVRGDTRETVDATMVPGPQVCSGSWFTDDVWYSVQTGATVPANGITIEVRLDPSSGTELIQQSMAIYVDCDTETMPIECFPDDPERRTITFPRTCLEPNSTFLVRVWSAPEPRTNEGTFSICAFETPDPSGETEPQARIIFEETFDDGFGDFVSVSASQSFDITIGEMVDNNWMWTNTGCFTTAFGTSACLTEAETACQEAGVVGVPAGFYQSEWDGDPSNIGAPPYPNVNTFLVSPPIDLSKESCVNVEWTESARYLNGGTLSSLGGYIQYSLDDGETWINPSNAAGANGADITVNYGGEYVVNGAATNALQRSIPLIGAEGNTNVRIRFGFDGDFYFWIVDNIRVVEGTAADAVAQSNFFARAPINPMSIHMVDSYDFLIDIANLACEDLTNLNANVTIRNSAGEEVHNVNLPYGTVVSDSLAENQAFFQPFTPAAVVDEYTNTYTVTADRDDDPSNNVRTFITSVVDETVFRKEEGNPNGALSPNPAVFWTEENEAFTWEVGNMFYAPNGTAITGEQLRFNEISFQLDNADVIQGDLLNVFLYEVFDNDFDNIVSKGDDSELIRLGGADYTVTGTENGLITVQLFSFSGNDDDLIINANTHYLATVETTTTEVRTVAMAVADDDTYEYSAAIFAAQQNALATGDLTQNRYSHAFAITKENYFRIGAGNTGDNTTGNFGDNITPVVRLGYEVVGGIIDATVEINNSLDIAVSPNPTASELTLNLSIEQATDMEVSIIDLAGRVISTRSLNGVTEAREEFNVSNLANGVYMIHINTKDGVQTEKFVVSK